MLLKYVSLNEAKAMLLDIHASIYAHLTAPGALIGKAFKHGFYRTTALIDARDIIKSCKGCQYYAKQNHLMT